MQYNSPSPTKEQNEADPRLLAPSGGEHSATHNTRLMSSLLSRSPPIARVRSNSKGSPSRSPDQERRSDAKGKGFGDPLVKVSAEMEVDEDDEDTEEEDDVHHVRGDVVVVEAIDIEPCRTRASSVFQGRSASFSSDQRHAEINMPLSPHRLLSKLEQLQQQQQQQRSQLGTCWDEGLNERTEGSPGPSPEGAAICSSSSCFLCKHKGNLLGDCTASDNSIILAINRDAVFLLRPNSLEVVGSQNYTRISGWSHTDQEFAMGWGGPNATLSFETQQGAEIARVLERLTQEMASKRKELFV